MCLFLLNGETILELQHVRAPSPRSCKSPKSFKPLLLHTQLRMPLPSDQFITTQSINPEVSVYTYILSPLLQWKIKVPFSTLFLGACCQEQNMGLYIPEGLSLKVFCCHFHFNSHFGGVIAVSTPSKNLLSISRPLENVSLSLSHTPSLHCLLPRQHTIMERAHMVSEVRESEFPL